jgi:hypothetical protein
VTLDAEYTKSLVEKLYKAFNDPGVLGMGGTDEEAVMEALEIAKEKGLMREVDALYRETYLGEPSLKEELDDELSGDDFKAAMKLYDEGMKGPPKPKFTDLENPVIGTITPNVYKVELSYADMMRKYRLNALLPDISRDLTARPSTGEKGAAPKAGSSTPDFGELLTFEKDLGRLHVRIKIPSEAGFKYPIHFQKGRSLDLDLNISPSDSGTFNVTVKLLGSPDYTVSANIGVADLTNPKLSSGLVFESTKSVHYEQDKEALKKKIQDAYTELEAKYKEFVAPSEERDPVKRYKAKGEILGKMAGKIAEMYQTFDSSKADAEPSMAAKWNFTLGVNVKLDKSGDKTPAEKNDTIDLTFKAVF